MMTKKREMAEWILDFFRNSNIDTGQIVMMRSLQNKLIELNPKERDLFVPVANELIDNGYFTYEEGKLQCLRLTQKGRDYIYDPAAELDCCYESKHNPTQTKYIEDWYYSFVAYVNQLQKVVAELMTIPGISDDDKKALGHCLEIIDSEDVKDIENNLSEGNVSKEVLDKIELLKKDFLDKGIENLQTGILLKEYIKRTGYLSIEQEKKDEEMRLKRLNIIL